MTPLERLTEALSYRVTAYKWEHRHRLARTDDLKLVLAVVEAALAALDENDAAGGDWPDSPAVTALRAASAALTQEDA
jgi:hypothetical protein